MKIAVIAKIRYPIAEPFNGGLESFTYHLCKEYIEAGHEVDLYAHPASDPRINIKPVTFPLTDKYSDIYENDRYLDIVKAIEEADYDFVHDNSTHHIPILWGARTDTPIVVTLHTPPYSHLKAATTLASYAPNIHFVSVSKSLEKTWSPFIHQNLSVIHNGIDIDSWTPSKETGDYLFWYGRVLFNKGLDIALDTAHKLDMPLRFAGPIHDKDYHESEIAPRIRKDDIYLGHLSQSELNEHLSHAKALLHSARWDEPFGLTVIEALAAGTPVVGYDRGAFRELVSPTTGVIATGTNVSSLADAVRSSFALPKPIDRSKLPLFSQERMIDQYISLGSSII